MKITSEFNEIISDFLTENQISFEVYGDQVLVNRTSMCQAKLSVGKDEQDSYDAVRNAVIQLIGSDKIKVYWGSRSDEVMGFDVWTKE